jgi:predicted ATPase/DNA-binding SARP family transcriptional activator
MPLRLLLFGTPTLEHEGAGTALAFERRHQLVVLLALRRGWVTRAEVAALLWPEQESKLAYSNLRKTLFRLQSLPWAAAIESQGSALRFEPETDVAAFDAALAAGRADEALALVRGELLAGFDDGQSEAWTQWLRFERERVRGAWRGAALERAGSLDAPAAVALSARLLEADPLDEAALGAHLDALSRDGQTGAARQAYRRFAERLAEELGIEPGAQLRAQHEALSAPLRVAPPAARDDGFIGRAVELQRIADLLARDECRLLCLIGPGGAGKTRLATRALHTLDEARFADGALLVELEDATTVAQFGQRLADALGIRAGHDALRAATAALAARQALVVLDNFEPLAEHAAALIEPLLAAAPRLKLLVTSRVRLAVAGEWSMPLEGLPFPEPEDEDRAEAFDAVRLFVRAAQRVEPTLSLAAERAAIIDICRQVDGLPLALELAAAWTRLLSCPAIADELRRGLELLQTQDASHPARHASIGVVFDESWRRLAPAEQCALARLSIFRGGFTVEATRAVIGAALPVLGALADKSLLRKNGPRLVLHPLLQQLAAAKLDDEGDAARSAVEAAHAKYFHAWLQRLWRASEDGQAQALAAIETDFENCRQAWAVAIALGDGDALARSAPTLLNFIENRARFEDGLALWRQALDSRPAPEGLNSLLRSQAALIEMRLARYDDAKASASRALEATTRGELDRDARYQSLSVLAGCALATGSYDEARRLFLRALALARARATPHDVAGTLENLGIASKRLGRYEESLRLQLDALAEHRRIGDGASEAMCLSNLASLEMFMDDSEAAAGHLREGLVLAERHGLTSTQAFARANLTELAFKSGDLTEARSQAERALEIAHSAGIRALVGWLEIQLSRLAARCGEHEVARSYLAAGTELALALGAPALKAAALLAVAEAVEAQGHAQAARRILAFGVDQGSLSAPDRDELRAEWARRASPTDPDPAWPGFLLDGVLNRVVIERELAYAPLVAALRGAQPEEGRGA